MNKAQKAVLMQVIEREKYHHEKSEAYKSVKAGAHEYYDYWFYTDGVMAFFLKENIYGRENGGMETEDFNKIMVMTEHMAMDTSRFYTLDYPLSKSVFQDCIKGWLHTADMDESQAPTIILHAKNSRESVDICLNAEYCVDFLTVLDPEKTDFFVTDYIIGVYNFYVLVGKPKTSGAFAPCGVLMPTKPDKYTRILRKEESFLTLMEGSINDETEK